MRVFLASTVFDLIDIRAELSRLLRRLGASPVLSDEKLSHFKVAPDRNSIETCLLNVGTCDAMIVVLDRRYGSSLGECGFEDISATHLEYRHAHDLNIPIHFYVRDRLEADFSIHRKNKDATIEFVWVGNKDRKLFEFLLERRQLSESGGDNWYHLYTNVRDLKQSIRRHFEPALKPKLLLRAMTENAFPYFSVIPKNSAVVVQNVGTVPAFGLSFCWHWPNNECRAATSNIVEPRQELQFDPPDTLLEHLNLNRFDKVSFTIEYGSTIGITVRRRWEAPYYFPLQHSFPLIHSIAVIDDSYFYSSPPSLTIQQLPGSTS